MNNRTLQTACLLLVLAMVAGGLQATTFVMMSDEDLLTQTPLVIDGRILESYPAPDGRFVTIYRVQVLEVLKNQGDAIGEAVTELYVQSAGARQGTVGRIVHGAPQFDEGERVLLFLIHEAPGEWQIHQEILGAFHEVSSDAEELAIRALDATTQIDAARLRGTRNTPSLAEMRKGHERSYQAFARWIRSSASPSPAIDYFRQLVPLSGIARQRQPFTLLGEPNKYRWPGGSASFQAHQDGQTGVGAPGLDDEVGMISSAAAAWSAASNTDLSISYGGSTTAATGFSSDGTTSVLWNDPNGEIAGSFSCSMGGVLAIGGVTNVMSSATFTNGDGASDSAFRIAEGDVVINDNAGCFLNGHGGSDGAELLAHEIGHALGFGHSNDAGAYSARCNASQDNDALMRSVAHGDGRGASLRFCDQEVAHFLYPSFSPSPGTLRFSTTTTSIIENDTTLNLTVQRVGGSVGAASVNWVTTSASGGTATANVDYDADSGTLNWTAGDSASKVIPIQINEDLDDENNETFRVVLSGATSAALDSSFDELTVTILDDDDPGSIRFSSSSSSVTENETSFTVLVQRIGGSSGSASVNWLTQSTSQASAPADYNSGSGTLNWANGDATTKQIQVQIHEDSEDESNETFRLQLSGATGASLGSPNLHTVTILDDDGAPASSTISFLQANKSVNENAGTATITLVRSSPATGTASAQLAISGGTATSADHGSLSSLTVSWSSGQTGNKSVTLPITNDTAVEGNETIELSLGTVIGSLAGSPSSMTLTITDDDSPPPPPPPPPPEVSTVKFAASASSVIEGGKATINVTRTGGTTAAASVQIIVTGATATGGGSDYAFDRPVLSWGAGQGGNRSFSVSTVSDTKNEGNETAKFGFTALKGLTVANPTSHQLTIIDQGPAGVLQFTAASYGGAEGDLLLVEVERLNGSFGAATVTIRPSAGEALANIDFNANDRTVSFLAGQGGKKTASIPLSSDSASEGIETFNLSLVTPTGAKLGTRRKAIAFISDDDFSVSTASSLAAGAQRPAVAFGSRNELATAWQAPDGDGNGVSVKLDSQPSALASGPIRLHSAAIGDQERPSVDVGFDGGVLAVWIDDGGTTAATIPGSDSGLGGPEGATGPEGEERGIAAVWSGATSGPSVHLARIEPNGVLVGPIELTTDVGVDPAPQIGADKSGGAVILWRASGGARLMRLAENFKILANQLVSAAATDPFLAVGHSGDSVVVWTGSTGIVYRLFDDKGLPKGSAKVLPGSVGARDPAVAVADDGTFAVVWVNGTTLFSDVVVATFDANGEALGGPTTATTEAAEIAERPNIASNAIGDLAVAWVRLGTSPGLYLRLFDDLLSPVNSPRRVVSSSTTEPRRVALSLADDDEVALVYELENKAGTSTGSFLRLANPEISSGGCVADSDTVCLANERYRVRTQWQDPQGNQGSGHQVALTANTAYFWFFAATNVEMVVKVLNACSFADHFWTFAGGLTNVEVNLVVDDTLSGDTKTYFNRRDQVYQPIQDTGAFETCDALGLNEDASSDEAWQEAGEGGAEQRALVEQWQSFSSLVQGFETAAGENREYRAVTNADRAASNGEPDPEAADFVRGEAGLLETTAEPYVSLEEPATSCTPSATRLCISDRFQIDVDWKTANDSGQGSTVKLTDDTGYFWFFAESNVEIVVKVLNACSFANHYWVFAGGLTNQETTMRVTDSKSGQVRTYKNPFGKPFVPVQDNKAFATCP